MRTCWLDWNARHNLVSAGSLADLWRRHFWDSAQLVPYIPTSAGSLVDLGSGAGFPGLVIAEILRERPGFRVVLYEATAKKCRFLEAVAERLNLTVEVRQGRIEDAAPEIFDVYRGAGLRPDWRSSFLMHSGFGVRSASLCFSRVKM